MIDLDKEIELYKSKVAFYESQNTRGEYKVTVRELKYVVELLETLRSETKTTGDLISREALKRTACVKFYTTPYYKHILDLIDNAQAVDRGYQEGHIDGMLQAEKLYARPQGDCENCDYRKFSETCIDAVVEVMNEYGITSVEELMQRLKGGAE